MKHECTICKRQFEERDLFRCSASPTHTQWLCWECWKHGQGEVGVIEIDRKRKQRLEGMKKL